MEMELKDLVTNAMVYSMNNMESYVIKIVGQAVTGYDLEEGNIIDSEVLWNTAYDMHGEDTPESFENFMEEVYGESYVRPFPEQLGDELRDIIDSFEWKD